MTSPLTAMAPRLRMRIVAKMQRATRNPRLASRTRVVILRQRLDKVQRIRHDKTNPRNNEAPTTTHSLTRQQHDNKTARYERRYTQNRYDPGSERMTEEERERYLHDLDEELLKGSVLFSAWCHFLILESDTAFIKGAHLAALLTAMSGIEAQLRFDNAEPREQLTLAELINKSPFPESLKRELNELRRFRNGWVHVADPWDESLVLDLEHPETLQQEFELWALRAVTALRRAFYSHQGT